MQIRDYSASEFPSADAQRDALQKGLGRALQWAQRGRLSKELLLAACLKDQRYDHQCEPLRGRWLWELIQAADAQESFRTPIWEALHSLADDRSNNQLCDVAKHYALHGDPAFVQVLRIIVERPGKQSASLGDEELIAVDGEAGLRLVIRAHGKRLLQQEWEWEWEDERGVEFAREKLGEAIVDQLLNDSADPDIRRFREQWATHEREREKYAGFDREEYLSRLRSYSAQDILADALDWSRQIPFRGWGLQANDEQLAPVLDAVRDAQDVEVLKRLLTAFSNRALPRFEPRMLDLALHENMQVRRYAYNALGNTSHPEIRHFAFERLPFDQTEGAIGLFTSNFFPGDEELILAALDLPDAKEDFARHNILFDVRDVLEANEKADTSRLGLVMYAETPCELCRLAALKLLLRQSAAPSWLLEECRFDSCEETRALVD